MDLPASASAVMLQIVLFEPEIPPNTGNIIRLCANTGASLHLIQPLGFEFDDRRLRRAGLDYHEWATVRQYTNLAEFHDQHPTARIWAFTTKAERLFHQVTYQADDVLLFGPETRGLPNEVLASVAAEQRLRIPMVSGSRSLNLANAVTAAVYQAWGQIGFQE